MSAFITAVMGCWPIVLSIAGVLWAAIAHKNATVARAESAAAIAQANTRVAEQERSTAIANATAAQAGALARQERDHVEQQNASAAPGDAARRLRDEWSRD